MIYIIKNFLDFLGQMVRQVEQTNLSGPEKLAMVIEALRAILIALGRERLVERYNKQVQALIRALVSINNLTGIFENRKGEPIEPAKIVGHLK